MHASGDAVELAYRRTDFLDKVRALMEEVGEVLLRALVSASRPEAVTECRHLPPPSGLYGLPGNRRVLFPLLN